MEYLLILLATLLIAWLIARRLLSLVRHETIYEYERGILFENGQFRKVLEPGQYWLFAPSTNVRRVDIRPRFISISGQEILSADNITLKISLAAQYAVSDPYRSLQSNVDSEGALYLFLQIALRELVGQRPVDELLLQRRDLGEQLLAAGTPDAESLGLELLTVQIKDISFPGELKRIYTQVVRAQKEGLAALEKARGEGAALRSLANAARMLDNNPSLLQLRALQAVSESSGNSVVLHMPPAPGGIPSLVIESPTQPPSDK